MQVNPSYFPLVILNLIQYFEALLGMRSCAKIAGQARNDTRGSVILNSIQDLEALLGMRSCTKIAGQARNDDLVVVMT
jgi:hypothetical protein